MSEKIRYTQEPLGTPMVVPDFLPRPEELVFLNEDKAPPQSAIPTSQD
jgi:hypothetical protein